MSSAEQMESEDTLSALGWSREARPRPSSKAADSAFPALSSMVVMKNVLVKQVRRTSGARAFADESFCASRVRTFPLCRKRLQKHTRATLMGTFHPGEDVTFQLLMLFAFICLFVF